MLAKFQFIIPPVLTDCRCRAKENLAMRPSIRFQKTVALVAAMLETAVILMMYKKTTLQTCKVAVTTPAMPNRFDQTSFP